MISKTSNRDAVTELWFRAVKDSTVTANQLINELTNLIDCAYVEGAIDESIGSPDSFNAIRKHQCHICGVAAVKEYNKGGDNMPDALYNACKEAQLK